MTIEIGPRVEQPSVPSSEHRASELLTSRSFVSVVGGVSREAAKRLLMVIAGVPIIIVSIVASGGDLVEGTAPSGLERPS